MIGIVVVLGQQFLEDQCIDFVAIAPDHGEYDDLEPVQGNLVIRQGQCTLDDGFAQGGVDCTVLFQEGDESATGGRQPIQFFLAVDPDRSGQRGRAATSPLRTGKAIQPGQGGRDIVGTETGRRQFPGQYLRLRAGVGQVVLEQVNQYVDHDVRRKWRIVQCSLW